MRRTPMFLIPMMVVALAGVATAGQRSGVTAQEATPSGQELEALVQRYYDAFNTGDVDALDDILAPDWTDFPHPPGPGTDAENFKEVVRGARAGIPDLFFATQDFIVEGNQVVVRSTGTGTHEGTFLGVPGTGTPVEFQAIDIHRVEGGRIVESYHVEDLLSVLMQVGAFPPATNTEAGTPAS